LDPDERGADTIKALDILATRNQRGDDDDRERPHDSIISTKGWNGEDRGHKSGLVRIENLFHAGEPYIARPWIVKDHEIIIYEFP